MPVNERPDHELDHRPGERRPERHGERHGERHHSNDLDEFFGMDAEKMSPKAQVMTSLAVIVPVALAGAFLLAFTEVWWIWFTFFWVVFPAFGLLMRGIAGLSEGPKEIPATNDRERELLGALREHGELTPARAAMETSLTVAEADEMLRKLAEGGHLDVRVRGGGLFYALWEPSGEGVSRNTERDADREPEGGG